MRTYVSNLGWAIPPFRLTYDCSMKTFSPSSHTLVISYLFLRQAIGYLGIALPFVLAVGGMLIEDVPVVH